MYGCHRRLIGIALGLSLAGLASLSATSVKLVSTDANGTTQTNLGAALAAKGRARGIRAQD